jgi:hypothetical protein
MKPGRKPTGCAQDATTRRLKRNACMKELRAKRVEAEAVRMKLLDEQCFAIELALYGPTMPGSSLNPKWLSAGGC